MIEDCFTKQDAGLYVLQEGLADVRWKKTRLPPQHRETLELYVCSHPSTGQKVMPFGFDKDVPIYYWGNDYTVSVRTSPKYNHEPVPNEALRVGFLKVPNDFGLVVLQEATKKLNGQNPSEQLVLDTVAEIISEKQYFS